MTLAFRHDVDAEEIFISGEALACHLERRVEATLREVEAAECWQLVTNPATAPALVRNILREVYLEITMYQPDAIEAAIASIGQMPRDMPAAWVAEMLNHQAEEFDHGEMALRDYLGLGGDETYARSRRQSPSAFAVAAIWRNITHKRDPFVYLGAVYLFDGLTPIVTERVMGLLGKREQMAKGLEFITHHAVADKEHTASIRQLIVDVAERYPASRGAIAAGYEYFNHVYPIACWEAAKRRALQQPA